jgi:hypothetical protein
VQDMTIDYVRAWRGARHLVWRDIQAKHFDIFDASDIRIFGGDYGPCQAPRDDLACVPRIAGRASNILLDGVSVHGMTSTDLAAYHIDGLFIRGGNNIIVRNSKFWGNMVTNIRIQDQECCANSNIMIENNWFDSSLQADGVTSRWNAIDVDNGVDGLVIRNNSFMDSGLLLIGTYRRSRIVNNLLENMGCGTGVKYSRNLFLPFRPYTGLRACGSTDRRVRSLGYVNGPAFDLRLRPQSPGFAAGDPLDCPAEDILRRPRLRGLKCDAGAHELQDAWVCHRSKTRGRVHGASLRVSLSSVQVRLKRGDTMGRCRSK